LSLVGRVRWAGGLKTQPKRFDLARYLIF